MKRKSIIFCVLVVLVCVLCFSACTKNNEKISLTYDNPEKYSTEKNEYFDYVSDVEIVWVSGSVKIVTGDVDGVTIQETFEKEKLPDDYKVRSYLDGAKLYIAFAKPGKLNITNFKKDLTVTFPTEMALKKVTVRSVSADVELDNTLTVDSLHAETVSGKVKAEFSSPVPVNFDVKTVSGDVVATFTKTAAPIIDIETVSGKSSIVAMDLRDLEIKTVSGGLILTIPEEVEYTATLKSIAGKIESEYNELTRGKGTVRITAESVSGNVTIKKA